MAQTAASSSTARSSAQRHPAVKFLLRAGVLMALLYALYYFPYPDGSLPDCVLDAILAAQGQAAAWLIGRFETGVSAHDALIQGRFPMRVVKACSSLDAQALYCATVLSFPGRLRTKLVGLGLGISALSLINIARIAGLYFVGVHTPDSFEMVHEEIFPLVLVLCACGAFAGWAAYASRESPFVLRGPSRAAA
jgi:exosortase family protein XrtM